MLARRQKVETAHSQQIASIFAVDRTVKCATDQISSVLFFPSIVARMALLGWQNDRRYWKAAIHIRAQGRFRARSDWCLLNQSWQRKKSPIGFLACPPPRCRALGSFYKFADERPIPRRWSWLTSGLQRGDRVSLNRHLDYVPCELSVWGDVSVWPRHCIWIV